MRPGWSHPFVVAALAFAAAPANAATVDADAFRDGIPVQIDAARGERNDMTVMWNREAVIVRDRSAPLRARSSNCEQMGRHRVRCRGKAVRFDIELGDRADTFSAQVGRAGPHVELTVDADAGDDTLTFPYGAFVEGDKGSDRVTIERGRVSRDANVLGGGGDDVLTGAGGRDSMDGGPGNDRLRGRRGADRLFGGGPFLESFDAGRDRLTGGPGADLLDDGDSGSRIGRDFLVGGRGTDRVASYEERGERVVVDISDRAGDGQRGEDDVLRGMENVRGGVGDDRLIGDGDANRLEGWSGDDVIRGHGGDDRLVISDDDRGAGDRGDDRITFVGEPIMRFACGRGTDTLAFNLAGGTPGDEPRRGLLVPRDCEWMYAHHRIEAITISAQPRVMGSGVLAFRLREFDCCAHTLALTRPEPPFEELDSAPVDNPEVRVDPGGADGTLRVSTFDGGGEPLVWRFGLEQ